jgi:hypothetical protein
MRRAIPSPRSRSRRTLRGSARSVGTRAYRPPRPGSDAGARHRVRPRPGAADSAWRVTRATLP